jgi:hypothetical protein
LGRPATPSAQSRSSRFVACWTIPIEDGEAVPKRLREVVPINGACHRVAADATPWEYRHATCWTSSNAIGCEFGPARSTSARYRCRGSCANPGRVARSISGLAEPRVKRRFREQPACLGIPHVGRVSRRLTRTSTPLDRDQARRGQARRGRPLTARELGRGFTPKSRGDPHHLIMPKNNDRAVIHHHAHRPGDS